MSDPIALEWATVAKWLWGILVTGISTAAMFIVGQVRAHSKAITVLRATVVTREEFLEAQAANREQLNEAMDVLGERMDRSLREAMTRIHETQNLILQELLKRSP